MYSLRTNCIFCKSILTDTYFKCDYTNYVAHYALDIASDYVPHTIPFNIYTCGTCKTAQLKYLGDISEIYRLNHADSTGATMINLHTLTKNTLLKYKDRIRNILEIGSSIGVLADLILNEYTTDYYIIEPAFNGNRKNKYILDSFYEDVDDTSINANTLIISHVFEHFYNPLDILEKINKNKNLDIFCLVFPDLEYYINNNVLHVLNTEHTYYIDNDFLISLLKIYNFTLLEKINYTNHSVIFIFEKVRTTLIKDANTSITNTNYSLDTYFNTILDTVNRFNIVIEQNQDKDIYIWPASIHCLYLCMFGLHTNIKGFLDNSPNKINKMMYGYNMNIYSFSSVTSQNNSNTVILINGGIFNNDIQNIINTSTNIKFITI